MIVALDAALPRAGIAVVADDGEVLHRATLPGRPGLIETLPVALADAVRGRDITAVAVTVGPGSFTGLRTAIALAQGFAAASAVPLLGVRLDEAFAAAFPLLHRPLWVAVRARPGRLFLIRDGAPESLPDEAVPRPAGPLAIAGDAGNEIAARLAAQSADVMLTDARLLDPAWVARAALHRRAAGLEAHPALPLYVDPPEAKLPAAPVSAPA